ncbi:MAG: PilT/PilU family type 4a pilus ATPase [Gammaproteobacteria bacterium]|nr:PilT/PilU family type 4a pilus ATPase [Gammaproteobacteria bacterium]
MELSDYLKLMVQYEASDLYLTTGAPPSIKIHGAIKALERTTLPPNRVKDIAYSIMDPDQLAEFEQRPELNLAVSQVGLGRFRANIFKQRSQVAMVIRHIKTDIPNVDQLLLPEILKDVIMEKRGLVLFVGGTGSGKSTSCAALLDYRNANASGHIITIEDPIEFIHQHKRSIINQREVGIDTDSYEDALKNTLRQAPDVIQIGEIRDRDTMEHAIAFAETGHLCVSTLHANNANQALDRIINFFPDDRRAQVLMELSMNMRAIVSQRLILCSTGKRAVAVEILLNTPLVSDLVLKGDVQKIKEVMEKSENLGMQTFDNALFKMVQEGRITAEEALKNADSPNNLRIKINFKGNSPDESEPSNLSLAPSDNNNPFL